MGRNYRNEIVVAVVAVVLLVTVLGFASLLSSISNESTATPSEVAQNATDSLTLTLTPTLITLTPNGTSLIVTEPNVFETIAFNASQTANAQQITPSVAVTPSADGSFVTQIPPTVTLAARATIVTATVPSMLDTMSPSATERTLASETPTKIASMLVVPSETAMNATSTATQVAPSATDVISSATPKNTASRTPVPSTISTTKAPTEAPKETSTVAPKTPTATFTPTPKPPTATFTASATPRPPTATFTPTPKPPTATLTASATPRPPTATFTATRRPTNTATPRPTNTPTITPVLPTATPAPTIVSDIVLVPPGQASPTRTPSNCVSPNGWTTYQVQAGNTLFAIAQAVGSTVDELKDANCIADADSLQVGDVLFVPSTPIMPVATSGAMTVTNGLSLVNRGCVSADTFITSPITLQHFNGVFTVFGSATRSNFWYYKIEVRPDTATVYNFYLDSYTPVVNGALGQINATLFGKGLFWVRLSVVDLTGGIQSDAYCEVPLIFE